jgi:hypothetical protein
MAVNSFGNIDYTVPGSGMTLISTTTLSSSGTTLSLIPQTYNTLYLVLRNAMTNTDGFSIRARFNADATASRHATVETYGSATTTSFGATNFKIQSGGDNAVNNNLTVVTFPDYTNTTTWKFCTIESGNVNDTTTTSLVPYRAMAYYNQIGAISSLSIFADPSATLSAGTAYLYGVK